MYSTDNGAEKFTWPDGGQSPFRGEKNTNWEGGYRVPTAIRWPGVIKPGTVLNDIFAHEDMLPTLLAAAGDRRRQGEAPQGHEGRRARASRFTSTATTSPMRSPARRQPAQGVLLLQRRRLARGPALRPVEDRVRRAARARLDVWQEPFVPLRLPKLFNLRSDPFETADHEGMDYNRWRLEHVFLMVPAQQYVGQFLATFKEFPPSQKPGSF